MEAQHILVPLGMVAGIIIIVIAILNYLLKRRILNSGNHDEEYIKLLNSAFEYRFSSLKWGLLLLFAGMGLVVNAYLPNNYAPLAFGIEAIFLAGGFLTYYFLTKKDLK